MNPNAINMLFPILIILVFYFMLIRPQMKQQRQLVNMQSKLKKNDEVVTTGGIHGTVANIKDRTFTLRVDDNVRLEVEKNAVTRLVKEG